MTPSRDTESYFDRIASHAEAKAWAGNVDKWEVIEPLFDDVPAAAKILECGAGTGMYTMKMLERNYRVTAVDLSREALRVSREIAERRGLGKLLATVQGKFEQAILELDEAFDVVA